jgi:hypothetical protein
MVEQKAAMQRQVVEQARLSRRHFLRGARMAAAGIGLMGSLPAVGQSIRLTPGDAAVLRFLAAAELLEDDLWQQYCELAVSNPGFNEALRSIDPSLVRYICDDRDDERSHANLVNAFLMSAGLEPVNLDPFRTLPDSRAKGSEQRGRLTNLTNLTVDTSWYNRYRGTGNPDFGDSFPQLVEIAKRPTIPATDTPGKDQLQTIAHSAAFHFAAIEQGGGSLYNSLISRVSNPEVVAILASIGPTEVYHFAVFHKSLEGLYGHNSGDGLVFPDLRSNPELAQAIMPEPCRFLRPEFPLCSVIRPRSPQNAGAVAAATGLVKSGLFEGQSQAFFDAVVALAQAADAAQRI